MKSSYEKEAKRLSLRLAESTDKDLLLEWANDQEVLRWSWRRNGPIKESAHKKWFEEKRASRRTELLIAESDNIPCGLVRVEEEETLVSIHYSISRPFRGRGLAKKMLSMAIKRIQNRWPARTIYAETFPENHASINSLISVGFLLESEDEKIKRFTLPISVKR